MEPEAKRVYPSPSIVAKTGLMIETEDENAQHGPTYLLTDEFAEEVARAITSSTDDPLQCLAQLAEKRTKLRVPRDFCVKHCPGLPDDVEDVSSVSLDYFLRLVDKTLIAHVIDTDDGKMSGRYCIRDLVHIRSTPTYA
jgi:hypothetical protein